METTGKKTAKQRFLRRSRALTLTISIPSLPLPIMTSSSGGKRSESVVSLRRSQSSRDMFRHKLTGSFRSETCLDKEDEVMSDLGVRGVSVINVSSVDNNNEAKNSNNNNNGSSFGYRLKRSLTVSTVSQVFDNLNKSFRVRRSSSQRDMAAKKNKFRRYTVHILRASPNVQLNQCSADN